MLKANNPTDTQAGIEGKERETQAFAYPFPAALREPFRLLMSGSLFEFWKPESPFAFCILDFGTSEVYSRSSVLPRRMSKMEAVKEILPNTLFPRRPEWYFPATDCVSFAFPLQTQRELHVILQSTEAIRTAWTNYWKRKSETNSRSICHSYEDKRTSKDYGVLRRCT